MKKIFILFFLVLSVFSLKTNADGENVGFSKGNQIQASTYLGTIYLTCMGGGTDGIQQVMYHCMEKRLEPANFDYFVGPKNSAADELFIVNTRGDGIKKSISCEYDGSSGKTKTTINLGLSTLFQKPLLEVGINSLEWSLFSGHSVLQSGMFEINVTKGATRRCPTKKYTTSNPDDCHSQYSFCRRYFSEHNYCR